MEKIENKMKVKCCKCNGQGYMREKPKFKKK